MTLFDPDPFDSGRKFKQKAVRTRPVIEVTPVRMNSVWCATSNKQHGVVHAIHHIAPDGIHFGGAPIIAWCGKPVIPITVEHGQIAPGCAACFRAGAKI